MNIFEIIREKVSITDHAVKLGIVLEKNGKQFKCPFHNDSNPSASLSETKGIFKCFVCGKAGDVTTLHSEIKNISLYEAAKNLNEIYDLGITFDNYVMTEEEVKEYQSLSELKELLQEIFEDSLEKDGMDFLRDKYGIDDPKSMNIGYVPENLLAIINRRIKDAGIEVDEKTKRKILLSTFIFKEEGEVLVQRDFMKDCIVFPFFHNSKITTFQFRLLNPKPGFSKVYFPSSEIEVMGERMECLFYDPEAVFLPTVNRDIENKKYFIYVEGPGDSGSVTSRGYNSGAFCTNNSSLKKLEKIKKIIDRKKLELIIWLDYDKKTKDQKYGVGISKYLEVTSCNLSELGIKHRVMFVCGEDENIKTDPADFLIKNKDIDISLLIEERAVDGIEFKINNCEDSDEFVSFFSKANFSETQMEKYIKTASKKFDISAGSISRQIKRLKGEAVQESNLKFSESEKSNLTAKNILDSLESSGFRFFKFKDVDFNEILVMKSKSGKVYDITSSNITSKSSSEETKSFFYKKFGLNNVVTDHKAVLGAFSFLAYDEAFHITKTGFHIHNDTPSKNPEMFNDIFVSLGEDSKTIIHIKSEETEYDKKVVEIENPSSKSSVLLQPSKETRGFNYEFQSKEKLCHNSKIIYNKVVDSISCTESDGLMLLSWAMASLMNLKETPTPVMWLKGGSGSGKTVAAKVIQSLITGKQDMAIESSMPSIFRSMKASPLFTIDNLESEDAESKKTIILAAATTKMRSKAGKSTNSVITEIIKSNLMLTSIEPYGKEEVSNRTLEIKFDRIHRKKREPETSSEFLVRNRDQVASTWIGIVAYTLSDKNFNKKVNMYMEHVVKEMKFIERASRFTAQTILILRNFLYFYFDEDEKKTEIKLREVIQEFTSSQESIRRESISWAPIIGVLETIKSELFKKKDYDVDILRCNGFSEAFEFSFKEDGSFLMEGSATEIFNNCSRTYKDIGIRMPFTASNVMSSRLNDIPKDSEWKFEIKRRKTGNFWRITFTPVE